MRGSEVDDPSIKRLNSIFQNLQDRGSGERNLAIRVERLHAADHAVAARRVDGDEDDVPRGCGLRGEDEPAQEEAQVRAHDLQRGRQEAQDSRQPLGG